MGQHTNLIRGFPNAARLIRGELVFRLVLFHTVMLAALACSSRSATAVQQASPELLTASPTENVIVEPVDWIFVIDTSASMAGLGRGTTDIFPRVQQTLREFVSALRDEDSLTVFVFDSTSRLESSTAIKSSADRAGVITCIDQLTAEGKWTHTGAALKDALQNVASRANPKRTAAIILLTDGKEDIKGIENPIRIDDAIKLIPDQNVPYIFYVSLGTARDPQLSNLIDATNNKAPGRGHILEDPRAQDLSGLASDIRTRVRTAVTPTLRIQPETLDLGEIEPGGDGGPYSIDVSSGIQTVLTLAPTGVPPEHHLEGLPDTLEVDPRQVKRVTFRLKLGEGATEGVQNFSVVISPPAGLGLTTQEVPITLVVHEGLSTRIIKWIYAHWHHLLLVLLIISILLVLLFLAREWLYRGRTPLDIVRDLRRNTGGERTAVLSTPDGPIHLDKPKITLGRGGSKLPNSSATMEINREGAYHIVEVREGSITITNPLHEVQDSLEAGNKQRLKNRDQLLMPGYPSPIVYLNTSRKH